jgi:NAD(P)-dependent dehydrogenase (short-subunit alcohol dehydrogenase family)
MSITFESQVAIVTGAGRGLGRGYARALAARGAKVAIAELGGVYVTETEGISLSAEELTPEVIAKRIDEINNPTGARSLSSGFEQAEKLTAAAARLRAR